MKTWVFVILYEGCGGNFSTRTGTLMSQNFPNAYPHNTDCLWTVTVERGRPIILTFEQFDVEGPSSGQGTSCQYDYVAVSPNFRLFL